MKLTLKLVTIGSSIGVVIPKDVIEKLNLEKGERITIEIEESKWCQEALENNLFVGKKRKF